jgi:hypothetical protein
LLDGVPVSTFATRGGIDDVLFRHRDDPGRFTVIHLSWLGQTEINALQPTVEFDGSFAVFLAKEARVNAFFKEQEKIMTPKLARSRPRPAAANTHSSSQLGPGVPVW